MRKIIPEEERGGRGDTSSGEDKLDYEERDQRKAMGYK